MDTFFIFGAKYLYILSLIAGLIFFVRYPGKRKLMIFGSVSLVLTLLVAKILNHFIFNPRPFVVGNFTPLIPHAADNGFPSDHMLLVSAIPAVIIYYSRKYAVLLWLIAIVVGLSRIYVGVHHPLDIEASATIAIIMTGISHYLLKQRKMV